MDKKDMFDYAAIPAIIAITALAFVVAWMGWV